MNTNNLTIEVNGEEHELINDALIFLTESFDRVIHDMPKDCESYERYQTLQNLKEKSFALWVKRFA